MFLIPKIQFQYRKVWGETFLITNIQQISKNSKKSIPLIPISKGTRRGSSEARCTWDSTALLRRALRYDPLFLSTQKHRSTTDYFSIISPTPWNYIFRVSILRHHISYRWEPTCGRHCERVGRDQSSTRQSSSPSLAQGPRVPFQKPSGPQGSRYHLAFEDPGPWVPSSIQAPVVN